MNHKKHLKKFKRTPAHRRALLRNLSRALIENERIETTEAKAKALRPFIEKLVTIGIKGQEEEKSISARRLASKELYNDRKVVAKLFNEIAPRYKERNGGYTRILKLRNRVGDNAPLALIEFVDRNESSATASESEE